VVQVRSLYRPMPYRSSPIARRASRFSSDTSRVPSGSRPVASSSRTYSINSVAGAWRSPLGAEKAFAVDLAHRESAQVLSSSAKGSLWLSDRTTKAQPHSVSTASPHGHEMDVGADLIAAAIGSRELVGEPTIVIDFGTATTYSAIDRYGRFVGVAIAPGLQVGLDALVGAVTIAATIAIARKPLEAAAGRAGCAWDADWTRDRE
jgi:hypothetical protein